jgi:two-component system chemotaxis sensor kinase CheA
VAESPSKGSAGSVQHQDQYFVRVGTAKLDQLVTMVGELVIAQTQVSQNPDVLRLDNDKLTRDIAQLNRITRDIQEVAMSMRMVPIRPTFERMARMVRDLARKLDKSVEFRMSGEETEVDKNMVEEIVDPLIHMVRNAVDHGLESPIERQTAGKPDKGSVVLEAYHQGGSIVIELRDDGKGLDRDRILQKAIERGLARSDEAYTDEQVYDFLFRPGFSLAKQISDISGRGVGMDVVRRSIEKLHGKVEVHSVLGQGSAFTIRLPLTLAIIDGMVVGVGKERYVLPLTSIVRSLRPAPEQISTVLGQAEMVQVLGELFPLVRLHARFRIEAKSRVPWEGLVVITEAETGRCGLLVDELLGIQQVVIKGLEEDLRNDKCLAGCTILGDGRVGLILDADGLALEATARAATA